MQELFSSDFGFMLSAIFIFAGMVDFMILTLFLSHQRPRKRGSDGSLTSEQQAQFEIRVKRYKILQFGLAMSGFLMVVAGFYGISVQVLKG